MRKWTSTLLALLLCSPALHAQAPSAPATQAKLDGYLNQWEGKMKSVETLVGDCVRTEKSKTFNTIKVYEGKATFMRPNFAILDLRNQKKPDQFEKYICTGTYLYEFSQMNKTIRVHNIQSKGAGGNDENFLSFLFGMKAEEAKKRYEIKLGRDNDPNYIYVDIVPKNEADKVDFSRAQLVLIRTSFLPRRLWFEQPNGDEVTWDLPQTNLNPRLDRRMFEAPKPPAGWQMEQVPRAVQVPPKNPPPRVIRPNQ